MLTTTVRPTSGRAWVAEIDVARGAGPRAPAHRRLCCAPFELPGDDQDAGEDRLPRGPWPRERLHLGVSDSVISMSVHGSVPPQEHDDEHDDHNENDGS
jgi:hypothetical protein